MKVCETKTRTYKVVTGYEDGECKEIEVDNFDQFSFWAILRSFDTLVIFKDFWQTLLELFKTISTPIVTLF